MKPLTSKDVDWPPVPRCDPNGRLFYYESGLYRAMRGFERPFYESLVERIHANDALRTRLPETDLTDLALEQSTAVLSHELITPVTRPHEWSSLMFQQAALCHCDVHLELTRYGYTLHDAHPWNVAFKGAQPVFLDFGSIVRPGQRGGVRRSLVREYFHYFVHPMYLMSKRQGDKCRRYLTHSNPPLELADIRGYFGPLALARYGVLRSATAALRVASRVASPHALVGIVRAIRGQIASLRIRDGRSRFRGYHDDEFGRDSSNWHAKQRHVCELLDGLRPRTVLDAGCATGWYSLAAAERGARVVAVDVEDAMVNAVYRLAADRRLPITTAVKNLFDDAPDNDKYAADMVLALAVVHHLVFSQGWDFEAIARTLARYARRCLVTEFIDRGDTFVKQHVTGGHDWYNLPSFQAALSKHFRTITLHRSTSENRTLVVCHK
jgi:hypothetical protein